MSYGLLMAQSENSEMIRVRLDPGQRKKWRSVLEDRKISQQKAIVALIEWVGAVDPLVQAMVFGQVPATPDLIRGAIERLGKTAGLRS